MLVCEYNLYILKKIPEGISGIPIPPGSGDDKSYIHIQSTASQEWNISHNLDKYPAVTVVDSAGTTVMGECEYIDKNTVKLSFSAAFSGKAYLN